MPPEVNEEVIEPSTEVTDAAVSPADSAEPVQGEVQAGEEAEGTQEKAEPEYQPNKKYKFTDEKGEAEAEFDEWVSPFLKKDTEDKFRDLFSKAKAVDFLKSSREKTRGEKAQVEQQFQEFQGAVKEVLELKGKDIGMFCDRIGLSKKELAGWVLKELEAEERIKDLPPHMQKVYSEHQELSRKVLELEKQATQGQNYGIEQATQALHVQLQTVLSKPEISAVASEYDTRRNRPGAFFEQVKREGQLEHSMTGKDLTADEAVQRALETLALQIQTPSQGVTPNGSGAAQKTVVVQAKPPTIPNVGNGTSAPTAKRPKSVDDLRRMAKEMQAQT